MTRPSIIIVTAAARAVAEATITAAIGEQYGFSRGLIPASTQNPTYQTPPTHYLACDMTMSDERAEIFEMLMTGSLPPPAEDWQTWGVDGLPTEAEAIASVSGGVMQMFPIDMEIEPFASCIATAAGLGLVFVPDPPL